MTADTNQGDGYTRTPHWTFDLMPVVTPAQFKVIAAAVRLTYGWHQEWTEATADAVAEMTGLNRTTAVLILNEFATIGLIERAANNRNGYRWRLVPRSASWLSEATKLSKTTNNSNDVSSLRQPRYVASDNQPYKGRKKE